MLGALLNIGGGLLGGKSKGDAENRAAQEQDRLANLNLDLQEEMYGVQREQFEPYRQFGLGAIPGLEQSMTGEYDYRGQPAYQFRNELGQNALQSALGDRMGSYAQGEYTRGLDLDESAQGLGRLYDQAMIGQGATTSAGQSAMGYGNALSSAYMMQGANQAASNRRRSNIMQETAGRFGEQMSGLPAYLSQQNYLQSLNQMGGY